MTLELAQEAARRRLAGERGPELRALVEQLAAAEDDAFRATRAGAAMALEAAELDSAVNGRIHEAVERVVEALALRGPMSGAEILALRIRGVSRNTVATIMREAEVRELVRVSTSGRRKIWLAVQA
ncbi:MAG: hypothetical protein CMH36_11405 [Microbacterium sp.]|uniref:DNA-binding protein n=1 Tax=Microbacterium ginsengisoli TaxID=400772 RepID=A0A3C1KE54_9MICO|nr:hypothetical protein [uncultured Microbacterium sp.]MAL07413.1 hypothetical protein [Microbacterium sp.]HAN24941.1 hypothetical protein [Microbacterium ginsengisoli]